MTHYSDPPPHDPGPPATGNLPPGWPPPGLVELTGLGAASVERELGYFRDDPFVLFGYCPGGGEVIWKDGHSSGFGTGGWKRFLQEIAPLARRQRVNLGDWTTAGTHVLLVDRRRPAVYALPRESAETFLSRAYGVPRSRRRCLCSPMHCATCPIRTCLLANRNPSSPPQTPRPQPHGRIGGRYTAPEVKHDSSETGV